MSTKHLFWVPTTPDGGGVWTPDGLERANCAVQATPWGGFHLVERFSVGWRASDGRVWFVHVPRGFVTDGYTGKKFPVARIVLRNLDLRPAVLHDYAYTAGEMTRKQADQLLYDALLSVGTSRLRAALIYCAVRMFGGKHYVPKSEEKSSWET